MLHKDIYSTDNVTKIPTPNNISPYLQAIKISNKPLTPLIIINLYMPSHINDIPLISKIKNQIQTLTKNHHPHNIILAGDFNRDILLQGHIHEGTLQTPNQEDKEWTQFLQNLDLHPIHNKENFSRQGGHNYTSSSLIDGFFTNLTQHTLLTCQTLINQNHNSDHYPVSINLDPLHLVRKTQTKLETSQKSPTQCHMRTSKNYLSGSKKPLI